MRLRAFYKGMATQRRAVGQGQLGRLHGGGEAGSGWRGRAGKRSQGRRNLPRSTPPHPPPPAERSGGAQVLDWLARDKAPPSSQRPLPDPRGTTKSLNFVEGNATLPQSKLDQRLAMQADPERILLQCRFPAVLTSSQVTPGRQVPGPHFE